MKVLQYLFVAFVVSQNQKRKSLLQDQVFLYARAALHCVCVDVIMDDSVIAEHFLNEVSVKSKQQLAGYDLPTTTREIQFSPEIRHAGITALSNFGEFGMLLFQFNKKAQRSY